jgi:hypothetical protein
MNISRSLLLGTSAGFVDYEHPTSGISATFVVAG